MPVVENAFNSGRETKVGSLVALQGPPAAEGTLNLKNPKLKPGCIKKKLKA